MLAVLAAATRRGEFCALIDASDALNPQSAAAARVDLDRFLWVRCGEDDPRRRGDAGNTHSKRQNAGNWMKFHNRDTAETRLEQVLRATDLLLESGGFGLIVLDLAGVPQQSARRIPLATWFRFRRAVEHKPTILLVLEQQPIAGSCSSLLLQLGVLSTHSELTPKGSAVRPAHAQLLAALEINVELVRSRWERKPARSVRFETKSAWAG